MADSGKQISDSDLRETGRVVRSQLNAGEAGLLEAGRWLDETYGPAACLRRVAAELVAERRQHPGHPCAAIRTQAHRPRGIRTRERRQQRRLYWNAHWPRLDLLIRELREVRPLPSMPENERQRWNSRLLLLIWLLTDPDADELSREVTGFQHWPWSGDSAAPAEEVADTAWCDEAFLCDGAKDADADLQRLDALQSRWAAAQEWAGYLNRNIKDSIEQPARARLRPDQAVLRAILAQAAQAPQMPTIPGTPTPHSLQGDTPAIGNVGMAWQDAKKRAERHVKAHQGAFPSTKQLAEIVGCSRPTIDKAVKNSHYLKARKAEAESHRAGREVALSDEAIAEASERQADELENLIAEQNADIARDQRQTQAASKRPS